jgi:hypothetical protein
MDSGVSGLFAANAMLDEALGITQNRPVGVTSKPAS